MIIISYSLISMLNLFKVALSLVGIKAIHAIYKPFLVVLPIGMALVVDFGFLYFQTKIYVKSNFNKHSNILKYLRSYLSIFSIITITGFLALAIAGFYINNIIFVRLLTSALLIMVFFLGGFCALSAILILKMAAKMDLNTALNYSPVIKAFLLPNYYLVIIAIIFAVLLTLETYYLYQDYILFSLIDNIFGTFGITLTYLLLVAKPKTNDVEVTSGSSSNPHETGSSNNIDQ